MLPFYNGKKTNEQSQQISANRSAKQCTQTVQMYGSRHVRKHEKNSMRCVRRLGTIIQSIFCAQSEAGMRLNFWKWSGESRYPGAFSPVMKTFVPPFLPTRLTAPPPPLGLRGWGFYCVQHNHLKKLCTQTRYSSTIKLWLSFILMSLLTNPTVSRVLLDTHVA